jgi:phage/plasmid-like protein (TIGR03299 family)
LAHELTKNKITSKIEMAYAGETPWHGLGQRLMPGASVEEWLEAAGMTWTIRRTKLMYYADRAQKDLRIDDENVALIRSDTGERLGIVSADYQVVQPYEVLEFFRNLVETAGFEIHTAGTLFGGKRYWALAKLKESKINGWDTVGGYYLLSTTADGTRSTDGRETTICVVCNNTLSAALWGDDRKHGFKMSHRQRFDAERIQKQLGLTSENFDAFLETANDLSHIKVSEAAADDFIMKLLRPSAAVNAMVAAESPDDSFAALLARPAKLSIEADEDNVRRPRGADMILDLFLGSGMGANQKGRAGTAWGLVNAVTEYVDHHATAKTDSHRLDRAFWGTGDELKTEALQLAQQQFA